MTHTHEFVEVDYLNGNIKLLSFYINSKVKNNLLCLICDHKWQATYDNFKNNNTGCPKCSEKLKPTQEFVEEAYLKSNIKMLSVYISNKVKNDLLCLICDHKWQSNFNNFQSSNCGCPECSRLSRIGEIHHRWNPNLTDQERLHRDYYYKADNKKWVKAVFKRDDHTCQSCNVRGGKLEAHHIAGWATHKSERFNVENGVTLCKPCHDSYHYDFNPSVIEHNSFYHWMVLYSVIKPENWLWTVQYPKSMNGWLKAFNRLQNLKKI